ncbi:unnamed protein product, partial [Amoebophrya sp. A25]|eukprot:GSA25T00025862001.1
MTQTERAQQELRNYKIRQLPTCKENVVSWPNITAIHPKLLLDTTTAGGHGGSQSTSKTETDIFWSAFIQYRNPEKQPAVYENYWTSRHFR